MKKSLLVFLMLSCLSMAHAETKEFVYDGREVYVRVKKDHLTTLVFPEPVTAVMRGFGADTYVVQHHEKDPAVVEVIPTQAESAEMVVSGSSGENYVLRYVPDDNFYTKLVIHKMVSDQSMAVLQKNIILPDGKPFNFPTELNSKITLKGNGLPLKIYLSTISRVTGYNIITTLEIDSQKTSINLEGIEVWRALKSLLYKFGYGFKVSQHDLVITETETRVFNIIMPAVEQTFKDETSNASFTGGAHTNASLTSQYQQVSVGTKIYYENSSSRLSLWSDLENNIKSMGTPKIGSYSMNKSTGSVVVTDKPQVLDQIGELIATVNESLSRQQAFEIQILEVTLTNDYEAGIDWDAVGKKFMGFNKLTASTNFSSSGFLSGKMFSLSATGPDISVMLKALDSMGEVNVISRPSITVSNLFPCIIQEVTSIPFISGTGQTIGNNVTQSNVTTSHGDGINTFGVPNLQGKAIFGYLSADSNFGGLGKTGGSVTMVGNGQWSSGHADTANWFNQVKISGGSLYGMTGAQTAQGVSTAVLNPYIVLNYVIKT